MATEPGTKSFASRGPVPHVETRRRNKTNESGDSIEHEMMPVPEWKPGGPRSEWTNYAKAIWNSARNSPISQHYQRTDWALLAFGCAWITELAADDLVIEKVKLPMTAGSGGGEELVYGSRPMTAAEFAAFNKMLDRLLFTEEQRRRARIFAEPEGDKPDEVTPEQTRGSRLTLIASSQ